MTGDDQQSAKPASVTELIDRIDESTYLSLKRAVELGRWESGARLNREQLANSLQLVIAYEHRRVPLDQRAGYIEITKRDCAVENPADRIKQGDESSR